MGYDSIGTGVYRCFEEYMSHLEDGGSILLRKTDNQVPAYMSQIKSTRFEVPKKK
jgi:hypothetical protein